MAGAVLTKDGYFHAIGYKPHTGGLAGDPSITAPAPNGGQAQIHYTPSRFKVVRCGRRWGKTFLGAHECEPNVFVPCPWTGEPQVGWIVGPQYSDTEKEFRIVYDTFRKLGLDRDSIKFIHNVESGNMHIKLSTGAEIIGKSAAHPESLVGEGLNWVLMVEAGRHKRRTWAEFIRPALSDRRGWALLSGVPEGKSANSLLYALHGRGQSTRAADVAWRSWKKPSWDNLRVFPGGRQDPEIIDAAEDLTDDEFDRQYGAEFSDKVGPVFGKEWDEEIHVGDFDYEPSWETSIAVDYGFTNPFVILFVQEGPFQDIRVIKELRWTEMDTPEIAHDVLARYPALVRATTAIYPDPAEPDDTRILSRLLRVPARAGTGGPLRTRIALIRRALKERNKHLPAGHRDRQPALKIDRSCKELIWEMEEGYRWPERRSEIKNTDENPVDKNNHGSEALGRFFRGRFRSVASEGQESFVTTATMG
jgi:hypothetical protein